MTQDWKSFLKSNPTDWLLKHENPSAHCFTMRDILEYPEKDSKVLEAKAAVKRYKKSFENIQKAEA